MHGERPSKLHSSSQGAVDTERALVRRGSVLRAISSLEYVHVVEGGCQRRGAGASGRSRGLCSVLLEA